MGVHVSGPSCERRSWLLRCGTCREEGGVVGGMESKEGEVEGPRSSLIVRRAVSFRTGGGNFSAVGEWRLSCNTARAEAITRHRSHLMN